MAKFSQCTIVSYEGTYMLPNMSSNIAGFVIGATSTCVPCSSSAPQISVTVCDPDLIQPVSPHHNV